MRFGVLGPVTVTDGRTELPAGAPLVRSLLAVLLFEAGQSVSEERLIEALWGAAPPASAKASLQNLVLRLRRGLGASGAERVRRTLDGYLVEVGPGELDLHEFEALRRTGTAYLAAEQWRAAAEELSRALALWRGEPLADAVPSARDAVQPHHVGEARLQTVELLARAWLRTGRYDEVVALLGPVVREHPWRESVHSHLMHALYGTGRQADALAVYQQLRSNLIGELGIEPSTVVAQLHQRILAGDPALLTTGSAGPAAAPAPAAAVKPVDVVPRQLPPRIEHFTGRRTALAALAGLLDAAAPVVALVGTAGVGKTALAVRWAGEVAERFPDGSLYVNLRGFDPASGPGVEPAQVLRGFLRALGLAPGEIPSELDDLVGLFRSLTADRRLLVVLDNARDAEQVRPLLCGAAGCLTIVTSRDRLTGLVAVDGARTVPLDLLPAPEAVALLARRLGADQAAAAPEAVAELAELCARLPLALNIAAARIATVPHLELTGLVALLRSDERLAELEAGDPSASVRAVFSWSYRQLSPAARRVFRLLGLQAGPDISAAAAASLVALPLRETRALLAELVGAHLLAEQTAGRYAFHDLLRVYAVEQAHAAEGEGAGAGGADGDRDGAGADEPGRAGLRVLDHYLHTARAAGLLLFPNQMPIDTDPVTPGTVPEEPADSEAAMAWFAAEKEVLTAAVSAAAGAGHDAHAWRLAWTLVPYFGLRALHHDLLAAERTALAAAERAGDAAAQGRTHRLLSQSCYQLRLNDLALAHGREALASSVALGDPMAEAGSHRALAFVLERLGEYGEAVEHTTRAHELFAAADYLPGQAWTLQETAYVLIRLDRHQEALACSERALALFRELGDRFGEAAACQTIGDVHTWLADHDRAVERHRRAVALFEELGAREQGAGALAKLGDACDAAGDRGAARDAWQRALAVYEEVEHPDTEAVREKLAGVVRA
ncbi:BTAD domain-containing putative transcriptional regulator [Kitasatospora sp. NPDC058965]|uniref:AfsR/SARP family transcriptional regulator n=1 Tax=Kitasatospora sp. NPDC058965 TaxID=3346682 RepID=UPI0036C869E0